MVIFGKPLEHFTYNLASIEGLKYVDVKISNAGDELSAPYKQLVITVTVQTDQVSLEVPIHVAVNNSKTMASLPLSPPTTLDREVDDTDREALADLNSRITGRGKIKDVHLLFLKKLYEREPSTTVAEATRALLGQFKDLQISQPGVRYHLNNTLGINLGNKILPEHNQFLQHSYKVDPDLSMDEARYLLCTQFDDSDTTPESAPIKSERRVYADSKQRHAPEQAEDKPRAQEQAEEDKLRALFASKLRGTGKITVDHLMFLHKLYKEEPTISVSRATDRLCENFMGLKISPSGVRYHLKNKLGLLF